MLIVFDLQMQTRIWIRFESSFFKEFDFPNRWQVLFKYNINEKGNHNVFRQKTHEDKTDIEKYIRASLSENMSSNNVENSIIGICLAEVEELETKGSKWGISSDDLVS